jgi:tetratricopeptide (TPR) repeat protein
MPAEWIDEGPAHSKAGRRPAPKKARARERGRASGRSKPARALDDVVAEFQTVLGAKSAGKELQRYEEALAIFEEERYAEARRCLEPLVRRAGDVAAVQDLLGLCFYRERKWEKAAEALERVRALRGDFVHNHAVLADCYRALGRHEDVELLWHEVAEASTNAELVAESRIVLAGSLADRGRLADALALFREPGRPPRPPREHHLRQWYVAADLTDRLGDVVAARAMFNRIIAVDPDFADVAERLAVLGA